MSDIILNKSIIFGVIGSIDSRYTEGVLQNLKTISREYDAVQVVWVVTSSIPKDLDLSSLVIYFKEGLCSASARNFLIDNTTSDYLVLIDSDMKFLLNRVSGYINFLYENDLVTARYEDYYINTGKRRSVYTNERELHYCGGFIGFKRELLNGLRYDIEMKRMQDVLFSFKLSKRRAKRKIKVYPHSLYEHMTVHYDERERYALLTINSFYKYRGLLISKDPYFALFNKSSFIRIIILFLVLFRWKLALLVYGLLLINSLTKIKNFYQLSKPFLTDFGFVKGLFEGVLRRIRVN